MSTDAYDHINHHTSSACCGLPIIGEDICSGCGEHCEDDSDKEEDAAAPSAWLAPCLVCGARATPHIRVEVGNVEFSIRCSSCGREGKPSDLNPAIKNWNQQNTQDQA